MTHDVAMVKTLWNVKLVLKKNNKCLNSSLLPDSILTIHRLLKCPSFPLRINNINLISTCEIPHLTSIALQSQTAGGISADITTSESLPQPQRAPCSSTSLIKTMRLGIVWPLHLPGGGTPAWFVGEGVGQPTFPWGRQSNKTEKGRGDDSGDTEEKWEKNLKKKKSLKNISGSASEDLRHRVNGK